MNDRFSRAFRARVYLYAAGSAVSTFGYLLTTVEGLGSGPLFVLQDGLQEVLSLSRSGAALAVGAVMLAVGLAIRAPLGIGTVALPVATAAGIAVMEPFLPMATSMSGRWISFVAGTAIMMLGCVLIVDAGAGASPTDGTMLGLCRLTGRSTSVVRGGMEAAFATSGLALGGHVGLGTVVMGVMAGPMFAFWRIIIVPPGSAEVLKTSAVLVDIP